MQEVSRCCHQLMGAAATPAWGQNSHTRDPEEEGFSPEHRFLSKVCMRCFQDYLWASLMMSPSTLPHPQERELGNACLHHLGSSVCMCVYIGMCVSIFEIFSSYRVNSRPCTDCLYYSTLNWHTEELHMQLYPVSLRVCNHEDFTIPPTM